MFYSNLHIELQCVNFAISLLKAQLMMDSIRQLSAFLIIMIIINILLTNEMIKLKSTNLNDS